MVENIAQELERAAVLKNDLQLNLDTYEYEDKFIAAKGDGDVHTTMELVALLERNPEIELDGRLLCKEKNGNLLKNKRVNREGFLAAAKGAHSFKESDFGSDHIYDGGGRVGDDFIPLISGPFHKQLYYYDYLRMHAASFHAFHHDPVARRVVQIIKDFSLGRGWRVDCDNPVALAWWRAFEEVNNLYEMMSYACDELSIYGETMVWTLPDNATKISYRVSPGQEPSRGLIPRVRLIDPSVIWEIVTYPEDITRVLYYQWVAPTQYQMYSGRDGGASVPGTKFIVQQIPGDQVMHFKSNCVSNEKRGRSVLFPALGYMKRLRDSVNWSIIAMQKSAAWSIDTTIEGSQNDIDAYVEDQQKMGTIPDAGSEFVHTAKIKREYLSNSATSRGGNNPAQDWCLSMISMATGVPTAYLGSHLSSGQNKASALVATEPVAKLFEMRQLTMENMLKRMAKNLFKQLNLGDVEIEVTFPTIAEQDRTAKLKDLYTAQEAGWISKKRAATIAAKELGITEYEYEEEQAEITADQPTDMTPLTTPAEEQSTRENPTSQAGRAQVASNDRM